MSCAVNKILVLDDPEITNLFEIHDVKKLKADWTFKDDNILLYLKKYNRVGIPFNIFYSKKVPEGVILNEILSKSHIKRVIKQVSLE